MRTAIDVVESDGRWEWVIVGIQPDFTRGTMAVSAISFSDRADAQVDAEQHLAAPVGGDGKAIRSKEDLRNLIKLISSDCPDCDDSYFGGIYWHERDELGCNWSVSMISGRDWSGCFDCVQPAATRLRQTYNIVDEG